MKAFGWALIAALSLGLADVARAQDAIAPLQQGQEKLAREAGAAVVGLGRPGRRGFGGEGSAAGFIIDEKGDILTDAARVPQGGGEVAVTFRGGHRGRAKFVAADPRTHVALLRLDDVEGTVARLGHGKLPVLKLGRSSELKLGRVVGTIGNPYDSLQTDGVPAFSLGIVSGLGRLRDADAWKGYAIETDAAINPGSFGGPLIDAEGRAVGVVLEAYSPKRFFGV